MKKTSSKALRNAERKSRRPRSPFLLHFRPLDLDHLIHLAQPAVAAEFEDARLAEQVQGEGGPVGAEEPGHAESISSMSAPAKPAANRGRASDGLSASGARPSIPPNRKQPVLLATDSQRGISFLLIVIHDRLFAAPVFLLDHVRQDLRSKQQTRAEGRLQDVYKIRGDVDLKLLETFEERSLQADKELPICLRVGHVDEQADEVLLIPLSFMHPDATHGGG